MEYDNNEMVVESSSGNINASEILSEIGKIEKQTEIFASMCPDEILNHYNNYNTREYNTTLMLGDISGFTELAEKYTYTGKGGPSKLTETLNSYIGAMVQEILSHHGDVLKFSGDAFIVMWKVEDGMKMGDIANEAMQTACIIQKHFGTYETDIEITLRVKLAIASGKIYFTSIGDPQRISHYIITGKPVWDVRLAEGLCRGGDILAAPSSWQWANPSDYVFKNLPDGVHTLILASSTMWEHPKEEYDTIKAITRSESIALSSIASYTQRYDSNTTVFNDFKDHIRNKQLQSLQSNVDYTLRPKVIEVTGQHLRNELRSYMLSPVIRSVELDEPLEHLTEIRQVVIVFINVITTSIGNTKLITLVNLSYKIICRIVSDMQGCVNKTSLFDKDLMFLCIFGLRGGKQAFESQIGLRCASKIKSALIKQKYIQSVTIGVSTGMTYCGVVGHILRREYTVMGLPVNKAARLMVAYNNMVVCDRESFLHSKLDVEHFILQKSKNLKGITNVGPIYEFREQIIPVEKQTINLYPLLGRETELKIFKLILSKARDKWNKTNNRVSLKIIENLLIIRGETRIGKSRLLKEMSEIIPKDIACNFITLNNNNNHIPYSLIYIIFCAPMGFTVTTTSIDRENILLSHLQQDNFHDYLCLLNEIFNVQFNISSRYLELSSDTKDKILKEILTTLVDKCFINELWIIIIDNIDNANKHSLELLDTIIKQHRIIFILSLRDNNCDVLSRIIETARIIDISGLDKWFHAGLACQFLNVVGIPPELEKTIQKRSMGNPGWIENYLLSLKQINGIEFKKVLKSNLRGLGLVIPPSMMLKNFDRKQQSKIDDPSISDLQERTDDWRMYGTSYEGSTISLFGISSNDEQEIDVCTISHDYHLDDITPELETDVMFLKLFDSLTPLDQILLKCTAVLGETIDRNLIEQLMDNTTIRDTGLSIKHLFEIKILGCAADVFDRKSKPNLFVPSKRNLNKNIEIQCGCNNLKIRDELTDLPKYASCRLLHFQIPEFREATHRLLTEYQKVEFHKKALKYLQCNTKKCESCGDEFFTRLLGQSYYINIKNTKGKIGDPDDLLDLVDYNLIHQRKISLERKGDMRKWSRRFIMLPETEVIPTAFSNLDFTNCQCNSILITVYIQILDHCRGIDRNDKIFTTILEFVEVLLQTHNIPQAIKLLNEAEIILNQTFESNNDELIIYPCLKAKIKTLQAKCYLQSGHVSEALDSLNDALIVMGYNFPKSIVMVKIKAKYFLERQKLMLMFMKNTMVGVADIDVADYTDQLSRCLSEMFNIFRIKGMQEHAHLAAIWSFNAALISNRDYVVLCTAYANMIVTAHEIQQAGITIFLENDGLSICNECENDIELNELQAIVLLYVAVSYSHLMKGETTKVSHLGFITLRLTRAVKSIGHELWLLPRLIYTLMTECQYKEIPELLEKLEFIANCELDKSGRTWYYALCTDLHLDGGIQIVSMDKCEKYYQQEGNAMVNSRDPDARGRYFTSMWLWHLRMNDWESATIWKSRVKNDTPRMDNLTIIASITALKKLEALLIYYVHKIDSRNVNDIQKILFDIDEQFRIIKKLKKVVKPILARYMLIKSYYHMIFGQSRLSIKLLTQAKNIADETGNKLVYQWADYCEKAWTGILTKIQMDTWQDKCRIKSNLDECLIKNGKSSVVFYPLPLPIYLLRYNFLRYQVWFYKKRLKASKFLIQ